MRVGLVGSTGFVGTTLARQLDFDAAYHRPNIQEIAGASFDLLICAGAPAAKWRANAESEADRENLEQLVGHLTRAEAGRLVLISTVDVYPDPVAVDEDTPIDRDVGGPYGRHRLWLEDQCRAAFDRVTVARLPGLFGAGLKKNLLFDLLQGRNLDLTHPASRFQFYDMARLWSDLSRAIDADLDLVNFATAPVSAAAAAREGFGVELAVPEERAPVDYDMQTRHAALFGGSGRYLIDEGAELAAIRRWADGERDGRPAPAENDIGATAG